MVFFPLALTALFASALASPAVPRDSSSSSTDLQACKTIANSISSASAVFYPGTTSYANDTWKWAPNSAQESVCTVEPGNTKDVAIIMKLLGSVFTSTKFNVKGGGHSCNIGFSSTTGVLIAMRRMDQVVYKKSANTVDIGPGNLWDHVYGALDGTGITVLGGRVSGVGAAGFALGGGYSWFANKYGLTLDSVLEYELVLPNATITTVTATQHPDIFFGLKGGFLNFGIVTNFVMKAIPVGQVWGGLINYNAAQIPAALTAIENFSANNTDPNAQIVVALVGVNGTTSISILTFYDAATPGSTFNELLAVPYDTRSLATSSFLDNFNAVSPPYFNSARQRTVIGSPRIKNLSAKVLNTVVSKIKQYTAIGAADFISPDFTLSIAIEPFIGSDIVRSDVSATAWPHATYVSPMALIPFWNDVANDAKAIAAEQDIRNAVEAAAVAEGQPPVSTLFAYPNYSTGDIPLTQMYGPNLPRLKSIAAAHDPTKILSRAGGIRFQ